MPCLKKVVVIQLFTWWFYSLLFDQFQGLPEELKSRKRFKKGDGTAKPTNGDASMAYEEKEKIVLEGSLLFVVVF